MTLGIPTDGSESNDFATIPDVSIDAIASRVSPQQVASGVTRGVQQLGGANVYSDGGNSQVIVKDTVPRVLMGNQATFGEGFYVSKSGIDATTNTNPANFIFNSNQNVFKIVLSGTTNFSKAANTETASMTVPHGLSFVPLVTAYYALSGTYAPFGTVGVSFGVGADNGKITRASFATVDATNIYFQIVTPNYASNGNYTSLEAYTVKYYLLQETAS